jgi:hypothetical protein
MREVRLRLAIVALLCFALAILCAAGNPFGAHLDIAIPVLAFCFLAPPIVARVRFGESAPRVLLLSLFTVDLSRAPPLT